MCENETGLWKYNKTTGLWALQRVCAEWTAENWLGVFQKDDPEEYFILSRRKPTEKPNMK
jgi:hypothetical protein